MVLIVSHCHGNSSNGNSCLACTQSDLTYMCRFDWRGHHGQEQCVCSFEFYAVNRIYYLFIYCSLFPSSDVDKEEHLIVTAPVWDQDISLSHSMGQDEPAVPVGGPVQVNIGTLEEEQTENLPDTPGSVPTSSSEKETFEMAKCIAPSSEPSKDPAPSVEAEHVLDVAPAPTPEKVSIQSTEPAASLVLEPPEQKPLTEPEPQYDGQNQTKPTEKTKTTKSKPPSLKVNTSMDNLVETNEEQELPPPKATYKFDPDQLDDSFNPFTSGGSKIPNSPPPCGSSSLPRLEPHSESLPICEASSAAPAEAEIKESSSNEKSVVLDFGLDEGPVSKPPPRKLGGKKTISKVTNKKQKPKGSDAVIKPAPEPTVSEIESQPASEPVSDPPPETALPISDSTAPLNLDDVPIPKSGTYNFDPSQWDDPNFNPFGSNNKMSSSPVLPKSSYSFDPDNFDDSVDPFKPSKALSTEDSSSSVPQPEKDISERGHQKTGPPAGEKKVRQIPKKSKERTTK